MTEPVQHKDLSAEVKDMLHSDTEGVITVTKHNRTHYREGRVHDGPKDFTQSTHFNEGDLSKLKMAA